MTFKQTIHTTLLLTLSQKITRLQQNLADLRHSAANETKSTAGDKYETALAMLQTEQDNTNKQLQELLRMRAVAENLDPLASHNNIAPGSLVETNSAVFYICVAAGKLVADGKTVIAISAASPLGHKLSGHKQNDSVEMNGTTYLIKKVS